MIFIYRFSFSDYIVQVAASDISKATNSFSERNQLREGPLGTTFQGTILFTPCRITSLSQAGATRYTEISGALAYLSRLQHPKLLGIMASAQEHAQLKYLVEAQSTQGTLTQRLGRDDGTPTLQWPTRIKIAVQTCTALLVLSTLQLERPSLPWILLRSEDVRLTNEYDAKISLLGALEAGLDLAAPENQGYLSPELQGSLTTATMTEKASTFSLGVFLGELLTGQRAVVAKPAGRHLSAVLLEGYHFFSERDTLVDQLVCHEWPKASREALLEVVIECLRAEPAARPTLTEVFRRLKALESVAPELCVVCYSAPVAVVPACSHQILCRVCFANTCEGGLGCPLCGSRLSK